MNAIVHMTGPHPSRIRHDDRVILGPAEGLHALTMGHGLGLNVLRDGRRADETNGRNILMLQNRVDGDLVTLNDIEQTVGKSGALQ